MIDDPRFGGRLMRRHKPGMWIGAVRRAFGPNVGAVGDSGIIDTHPPHYLIALWKPLRWNEPFLPRWPSKASLVEPDEAAGVAELLREVPKKEQLWLVEHELDWALIADIVMLCEATIEPYQRTALQAFARSARQATVASIRASYRGSDEDPGLFQRTQPLPLR